MFIRLALVRPLRSLMRPREILRSMKHQWFGSAERITARGSTPIKNFINIFLMSYRHFLLHVAISLLIPSLLPSRDHLHFHRLYDLLQTAYDPGLLLGGVPGDPEVPLQAEVVVLEPPDLLRQPQVVLLEPLEQLHNLRVLLRDILRGGVIMVDFKLELLVLLSKDLHTILEKVYVLTHTLHLLLVLVDAFRVLKTLPLHLFKQRVVVRELLLLLMGGEMGLGEGVRTTRWVG